MIRGLYTGASGMLAESMRTDVISNNLANANTAGFKKDVAVMKDFASMLITRINDGAEAPVIGSLGVGAEVDEVATIHSMGPVRTTGNDFDLAIEGKGFFAVETPRGIRYTRNGTFAKNARNQLVTQDGDRVLGENGPITITGGKMAVDNEGRISVDNQLVGKLQILEFDNEKQLTKEGASLYSATPTQQGKASASGVRQGFLEMSNVNVISEMVNLISNYRAYEVNGKVVQSNDQLLDKAVNEVGKL
ncbi:flagellar basal-body rod protein FlgF [Pelosinus sp. sgz500959]|uniref:flagellar basal-body rod protein FlgF n=1 Tax=Pelosinus sp. sgz500959 TaxID=3242472 RepID=UPI003672A50C